MDVSKNSSKRVISIFVLAMLNVSIMASLRNLPLVAEYGLNAIFYFILVALLFLIPSALVSAELATGWPKSGGVYIWVREAFGDKWGFVAIWMQWIHNVAWFPVIMTFVATTLAYVFNPELSNSKLFVMGVVVIGYWTMTFLNYFGIRTSSLFSTIGVIGGTVIPGLFIIGYGIYYLASGGVSHISFALSNLLPQKPNLDSLVFLTGLFLAFGGLEVSAGFASNVKEPQKNYPKAIVLSAFIVLVLVMLGALSIAVVLPYDQLNLVSGLFKAFEAFFAIEGLSWIMPLLGVFLIIGAIAEVNSWIVGPVKGLQATSAHGNLPPYFQKLNAHDMPTHLLFFQALIVTIASLLFIFMPSISSVFWILTVLSAQIYLVMYILMFMSAIKLRYSMPHVPRAYKVPCNAKGMWLFASFGILSSSLAILLGFLPPSQISVGNPLSYTLFLVVALCVMFAIPLLIHKHKKPSWYTKQ